MIHSKKRFQSRAGFTLIHQTIFIAMLPIVLVAAITWVSTSLKMSTRFKHLRESHVAMNQFANQFLDDVHGCKSIKLDSDLNQIELTGHGDQQITFQISNGNIQKTLTVDGEVVGRESYRLSDEYFVEWDGSELQEDSNRVALNIFRYPTEYRDAAPDSLDIPKPRLELVIKAKPNRWRRSITFGSQTTPVAEAGVPE